MQVNIRISDRLYNKLRELAKREGRTITSQLERILTNALEPTEELLTKNTNKPHRNHFTNLEYLSNSDERKHIID